MFLQTFSLEPALQTPCFVISCNGKTAQPRWGRSRAGSGSVLVVSPDKNQNPAQYNICVGTAKPSSPRFPESPTEQLPAMIPVPGPQRAWQGGAKGSSPMCSHTTTPPRRPGSARGCQVSPGGQGGTARASCPPSSTRGAGSRGGMAAAQGNVRRHRGSFLRSRCAYRAALSPARPRLRLSVISCFTAPVTLWKKWSQGCRLHYSLSFWRIWHWPWLEGRHWLTWNLCEN